MHERCQDPVKFFVVRIDARRQVVICLAGETFTEALLNTHGHVEIEGDPVEVEIPLNKSYLWVASATLTVSLLSPSVNLAANLARRHMAELFAHFLDFGVELGKAR